MQTASVKTKTNGGAMALLVLCGSCYSIDIFIFYTADFLLYKQGAKFFNAHSKILRQAALH